MASDGCGVGWCDYPQGWRISTGWVEGRRGWGATACPHASDLLRERGLSGDSRLRQVFPSSEEAAITAGQVGAELAGQVEAGNGWDEYFEVLLNDPAELRARADRSEGWGHTLTAGWLRRRAALHDRPQPMVGRPRPPVGPWWCDCGQTLRYLYADCGYWQTELECPPSLRGKAKLWHVSNAITKTTKKKRNKMTSDQALAAVQRRGFRPDPNGYRAGFIAARRGCVISTTPPRNHDGPGNAEQIGYLIPAPATPGLNRRNRTAMRRDL